MLKFNDLNKKSKNLVDEDERGNVVLCDAGSPTYEAIDYQPEELIYVEDAVVPNVRTAPRKEQEQKEEEKNNESELGTPDPKLDNIPQR